MNDKKYDVADLKGNFIQLPSHYYHFIPISTYNFTCYLSLSFSYSEIIYWEDQSKLYSISLERRGIVGPPDKWFWYRSSLWLLITQHTDDHVQMEGSRHLGELSVMFALGSCYKSYNMRVSMEIELLSFEMIDHMEYETWIWFLEE